MLNEARIDPKAPFPASSRWWVLLISFFVMFIIVALAISVIKGAIESQYAVILISSTLQGLLVFAFPAWLAWRLTSDNAASDMRIDSPPSLRALTGVLITYILAYPALNQIIYWNSIISFPESLHSLEDTLRAWEESGNEMGIILLSEDSWWSLIVNIAVIGIITGCCEEAFFRGGLQRMMEASGLKAVYSIWICACIFSAIHFQFFGFVPRLLLGAWFGYLLYWTRSLGTAAFAHVLNNSVVVIGSWVTSRYFPNVNPDEIGVARHSFPWMAIASVIAVVIFLWRFRRYMFTPSRKN